MAMQITITKNEFGIIKLLLLYKSLDEELYGDDYYEVVDRMNIKHQLRKLWLEHTELWPILKRIMPTLRGSGHQTTLIILPSEREKQMVSKPGLLKRALMKLIKREQLTRNELMALDMLSEQDEFEHKNTCEKYLT
jgi:hypothetical protein